MIPYPYHQLFDGSSHPIISHCWINAYNLRL